MSQCNACSALKPQHVVPPLARPAQCWFLLLVVVATGATYLLLRRSGTTAGATTSVTSRPAAAAGIAGAAARASPLALPVGGSLDRRQKRTNAVAPGPRVAARGRVHAERCTRGPTSAILYFQTQS